MEAETKRRAAWHDLVLDQVSKTGEVRLKLSGCSMLPALWPGDLVTVQRRSMPELHPGQIVLFSQHQKLTMHRIVRVADDHLVARGDSLPCCDPRVSESEVVGQVVSIQRLGREIDPEQSLWHRAVASILQRSSPLRRIIVILASDEPLRDFGKLGLPWAS